MNQMEKNAYPLPAKTSGGAFLAMVAAVNPSVGTYFAEVLL